MNRSIRRLSPKHFGVIMLGLTLFPTALPYLLDAPSFAPGTLIGCLIIVAFTRWKIKERTFLVGSTEFLTVALLVGMIVHAFVAGAIAAPINWGRFIGSLLIFASCFVAARAAGAYIFKGDSGVVESRTLMILLVSACASIAGFTVPGAEPYLKPVFPFTEPSHFALAFLPLILWRCVTTSGTKRVIWFAVGCAIALLLQNLTLLAGVAIVAIATMRMSRLCILGALVVVAGIGFGAADLSYYADRTDLSSDSQNISALVYLQGWELIQESVVNSHGWGLGFQQLGEYGTSVEAASAIQLLKGEDSNLRDGGFLLAKLLSELGVFALPLLAAYVRCLWRSLGQLRSVALGRVSLPTGTLYAHSIVVMYSVEILFRSSGYFTGTAVLFVAAVTHLHNVRGLAPIPLAQIVRRRRFTSVAKPAS